MKFPSLRGKYVQLAVTFLALLFICSQLSVYTVKFKTIRTHHISPPSFPEKLDLNSRLAPPQQSENMNMYDRYFNVCLAGRPDTREKFVIYFNKSAPMRSKCSVCPLLPTTDGTLQDTCKDGQMRSILVTDISDIESCLLKLKDQRETPNPALTEPEKGVRRILTPRMHSETSLILTWGQHGSQSLSSILPYVPLLDTPPSKIISYQHEGCEDSILVCNILRQIGFFRKTHFIQKGSGDSTDCFNELIIPKIREDSIKTSIPKKYIKKLRNILWRTYALEEESERERLVDISREDSPSRAKSIVIHRDRKGLAYSPGFEAVAEAFRKVMDVVSLSVPELLEIRPKDTAKLFNSADILILLSETGDDLNNVLSYSIFMRKDVILYEVSCFPKSRQHMALLPSNFDIYHRHIHFRNCNPQGSLEKDDSLLTSLPIDDLLNLMNTHKVLSNKGLREVRASYLYLLGDQSGAEQMEQIEDENSNMDEEEDDHPSDASNEPEEYEKHHYFDMNTTTVQHSQNFTCSDLPFITPQYKDLLEVVKYIPLWEEAKMGKPRILCWVFTSQGLEKRSEAVLATWGKQCDGLVFISNQPVKDISPNKTIVLPHSGGHNNLWHKLTKAVPKIYELFGKDYDFFYKCDDDTFPLMPNLRRYLLSREVQKAVKSKTGVYAGRYMDSTYMAGKNKSDWIHEADGCKFNVGGPGYILDAIALRRLNKVLQKGECWPDMETSADDKILGCCLEKVGILPLDTRGTEGGERFHPFDAHFCGDVYRLPDDKEKAMSEDWFYSYSLKPIQEGWKHCASDSIGFHHIPPHWVKYWYAIWHDCPDELKRMNRW